MARILGWGVSDAEKSGKMRDIDDNKQQTVA